jgi:hypothetical protein
MIRAAVHQDLPALCRLLKQRFSIEQDFAVDEERQRTGLQVIFDSDTVQAFAVEEDDTIIGVVSVQLVISPYLQKAAFRC